MKNLDVIDRHTINLLNKHDLLKKLIRSECIEDEVYSGEFNSQELDKYKQEIANKYNEENFDQLKKSNKKFDENSIQKSFLMQKFIKSKFEDKVDSKFLEIKNSLDQVVYSIIRVSNTWLAKELYFQLIEDNLSFGELAKKFSVGPEKNTRGVVGPCSFEVMHPKLRDLLRTTEMGKINPPMGIEGWTIISRLEDFKPAMLDSKTKSFVQELLFNEWIDIKVSEELLSIQSRLNKISSQSIV
tara:strand:- start:11161 stop:11886 length:726 start_codon:yes stop_codon:yes gene_type:complete